MRSTLEELNFSLRNPALIGRYLRRMTNTSEHNKSRIDIMDQDWDNLVILDACRYDMFNLDNVLEGELQSVISRGSATVEFLRGNFRDRELWDTVYVTANPQLYRHRDSIPTSFHDVVEVWQQAWSDEHGTVLPEMMTEAALQAAETYPNKRLIFHYVQPHHPFVESDIDFGLGQIDRELTEDEQSLDRLHGWMQLLTGQASVTIEEVTEAYYANLDRAVPHVIDLVDGLGGTTVITSDHGNMLGERVWPFMLREYGHPSGIYTKQLVEVPWFTISNHPRRVISTDPPQDADRSTVDDDVVSERLGDLGYIET